GRETRAGVVRPPVHHDADHRLRGGHARREPAPQVPYLDRQVARLARAVRGAELECHREHHLPTVREEYQRRVAGGRHRINRLIEPCRGVHPTAPEPVQVSSRYVLEGPEEIRGLRVLERPAPHVLSQGALERLLSEYRIP